MRNRSFRCFKVYFWGSIVLGLPLTVIGIVDYGFSVSEALWSMPFCISLAGIGGLIFTRRLGVQQFWKLWFLGYIVFSAVSFTWQFFIEARASSESPQLATPFQVVGASLAVLVFLSLTALELHALFIYAFRSPHIWNGWQHRRSADVVATD